MVGHGLQLDNMRLLLFGDLAEDLFEPLLHATTDDTAAVFRAPHDMERALVGDVQIGSQGNSHTNIIYQRVIY